MRAKCLTTELCLCLFLRNFDISFLKKYSSTSSGMQGDVILLLHEGKSPLNFICTFVIKGIDSWLVRPLLLRKNRARGHRPQIFLKTPTLFLNLYVCLYCAPQEIFYSSLLALRGSSPLLVITFSLCVRAWRGAKKEHSIELGKQNLLVKKAERPIQTRSVKATTSNTFTQSNHFIILYLES